MQTAKWLWKFMKHIGIVRWYEVLRITYIASTIKRHPGMSRLEGQGYDGTESSKGSPQALAVILVKSSHFSTWDDEVSLVSFFLGGGSATNHSHSLEISWDDSFLICCYFCYGRNIGDTEIPYYHIHPSKGKLTWEYADIPRTWLLVMFVSCLWIISPWNSPSCEPRPWWCWPLSQALA